MDPSKGAPELRFEPPGPGSWELDPVHFPRPVTRYLTETHPEPFRRGVQDFTRFYGMLIDGLEYRFVNGFVYRTVRPVAPEEIPVRFQRAEEVFQKKLWREQLKDWDETVKPASIRAHRELQAVDPDTLSDEELIAYLSRCRRHHAEMITQHMRHTAGAVVPTGDFLAHVGDWTGLAPAELLDLMRGASPVSSGASAELERLIAAMGKDPRARTLLASKDDPARVLDDLRLLDGEAGAAMTAYLDLVGNRLLDGFDISEPRAIELPDVLLRAIRVAVEGKSSRASDVEQRIAAVRAKVPEAHRAEFDELIGEARLMYRLRDERGVFSDIWASGLMRRAALAAGRRLAAKGRIRDASHFVDAGFDEMCALLRGADAPSADELAARAQYRAAHRAKDAPTLLGPPPSPPPDMSGLPPAPARMMRAIGVALQELFGSSEAPHKGATLRGLAASRGVYEGPARRISSPSEFDRIVKGDVLVTEFDDRGLQHPSAPARRDRDGQRRPPVPFGDRRARIRDSGRRRHAHGNPAHRRRSAGARRRRQGRSDGARMTQVVPLAKALDEKLFGSKAVGLGQALREGVPVPPGIALSGAVVEAVAAGEERAIRAVDRQARPLGGPLAVRSSAADEDGAQASFAGQHLTLLNVPSADELVAALKEIWWSANSDSAITYRQRVGLFTRPSIGVVVQRLLNPDAAGVMFTLNPVTGDDERVIEASWGLGEAVVAGLVIPDHFRLDRSGRILERTPGLKQITIRGAPNGGTVQETVPDHLTERLCLGDDQLAQLGRLADRCDQVYGPRRDIEWAIEGGTLYLLQCRAITTGMKS